MVDTEPSPPLLLGVHPLAVSCAPRARRGAGQRVDGFKSVFCRQRVTKGFAQPECAGLARRSSPLATTFKWQGVPVSRRRSTHRRFFGACVPARSRIPDCAFARGAGIIRAHGKATKPGAPAAFPMALVPAGGFSARMRAGGIVGHGRSAPDQTTATI